MDKTLALIGVLTITGAILIADIIMWIEKKKDEIKQEKKG